MIDLQDKFDELNDLPISEELLGAYAEGNLRGAEYREVQSFVSNDSSLSDLMSSVEQDTSFLDIDSYNQINPDMDFIVMDDCLHIGIEELELPIIAPELFDNTPLLDCDFTLGLTHDNSEPDSNDVFGKSPLNDDSYNNDSFHNNGMNDNFDF